MEDLHNWINTILLLGLGVVFFMQNTILKYMRTAMEAINPKKLLEAQEIWEKGQIAKYEMLTDERIREAIHKTSLRFQETNKDILGQFNELINVPFSFVCEKDWQERERYLSHFPKTASVLRVLLEQYDADNVVAARENKGGKKSEL